MTNATKAKLWRDKYPEKWAALRKRRQPINAEWARRKRVLLREKALASLGGACIRCGFSDPRALQIDHVFGGGRKELAAWGSRRYYVTGGYLDTVIAEATTGKYQVLCANCNAIKRVENHEQHRGIMSLEEIRAVRERPLKFVRIPRDPVTGQFLHTPLKD